MNEADLDKEIDRKVGALTRFVIAFILLSLFILFIVWYTDAGVIYL